MTALVLAMLRSRWGRALTVALLTALATVAAVAAPVYVARVDRQIVAGELAHASTAERNILVTGSVEASGTGVMSRTFENLAQGWLDAPGYRAVFATQFPAQPADLAVATAEQLSRVSYREGLCDHVVVVAGRCLMGTGDAVLGVNAAQRLGLRPGDAVSLAGSSFDDRSNRYVPAGAPTALTVVGIVRAQDSTEPYWGRSGALADGVSPVFSVDRRTLGTFARQGELQSYDAYPEPGAISVRTLPALREWLESAGQRGNEGARLSTDLGALLDRIDERRAQVRETVPFAVAPVLVLAWAVIILAVSAATRARRFEHGIIALRGVARPGRWWLAVGETLLSVSVGAVAGFSAVGGWSTPGALSYAGVAVLGAILAGTIVGIRTISAPVATLLRQVDRRGGRWSGGLAALVVLAAAVATFQLRGPAGGTAGGVALLAPALVMLAVALVAARVAPPLATWTARRALDRGRLTTALAGLRFARRPTGPRLLVVLTVALASLGFAAATTTAVAQRQRDRADAETGAPTVLSVGATSRVHLLHAVRAADPAGRYAMAVVPLARATLDAAPALAADVSRLAAVAIWPGGAPAGLDTLLHPPVAGAPIVLDTAAVNLDVTVSQLDRPDIALAVTVAPFDGRATTTAELGALSPGRHTYSAALPCTGGCRLVKLTVRLPPYVGPTVVLTVHNPPGTEWRTAPGASAAPGAGGGVTFTLPATSRADAGTIRPVDVPDVLPVVSTGPLPPDGSFVTFDSEPVTAAVVATVDHLPRLGTNGMLVDLEYADRLAVDSSAKDAEVWLSADAPPSVTDALIANGLTVSSRTTVAAARTALAGEGTALGLRFYLLAGLLAVALGASALVVGTVGASSADLYALRRQGLPARLAGTVEPLVALLLVLVAGVAGVLAAAVAWVAVAGRLPGLHGVGLPPLGGPALTFGAALLLLAVVALATTVRRGSPRRVE
jgi:hypothetical protein